MNLSDSPLFNWKAIAPVLSALVLLAVFMYLFTESYVDENGAYRKKFKLPWASGADEAANADELAANVEE